MQKKLPSVVSEGVGFSHIVGALVKRPLHQRHFVSPAGRLHMLSAHASLLHTWDFALALDGSDSEAGAAVVEGSEACSKRGR